MERRDSGLYVARTFNLLRFRAVNRTVTLDSGERAKVTVDDSGTVRHVEHGDRLDATVRPATIRYRLRVASPKPSLGGFARPSPIRAIAKPRRNQ